MIKISEYEKQIIIQKAFMDELEKLGGFGLLAKALQFVPKLQRYGKGVAKAYNSGGAKKAVQFAEQFTSPRILKNGKNITVATTKNTENMTGVLQKSIGGSIRSAKNVVKDVSRNNTFYENTKSVVRGLGREVKEQVQDARYRLVDVDKLNKDKTYGSMLKRTPVGYTKDKKQAIIKKRLPMQAAAITATPVGFGGMSALSGEGNPGVEGSKEFAKWTFLRPYAGAELAKDFISML